MEAAVATALERNLGLIAARLQVREAEVLRVAAGMLPNPEVEYSVGNVVLGEGNDQERGLRPRPFEQTIQSIGVSAVLDVWLKRSTRVEAAAHGIREARLQVEDAVREIRRAVRSAYAEVVREEAERRLAATTRGQYDESIALSRKRFNAGDISEAELRKVELEGLRYVNAEIDATLQLEVARQRLAELMAYPDPAALPRELVEPAILPTLDVGDEEALLRGALSQRPDLLAATAARQRATSELRAEQRLPLPDPSLGVAYTRSRFQVSGDNPHALGLSLSIPIPVFDRNQAGIGRARIEIERAELEVTRTDLAVRHDVAEALAQARRARRLLETYEAGGMLERARSALDVAERSYQSGSSSLLEILEARRTYLETQANYLAARYDHWQAAIDVAYATGGELP